MSNFIGIDLGTTNSAICTYDGSQTQIHKSREQNDVTPSVIFFHPQGKKYIGHRAYESEIHYHEYCVKLFKQHMGEDYLFEPLAINRTLTPEECSAEILKELFGYLPEEIRKSSEAGTVVTVPAAFNQMKRHATRQAAEMAGIGKVELMQEPVAAVMSFMQNVRNTDGIFLIYDLGGGTFDVAIAQSTGRKVIILAHGGLDPCGGRDFDRLIVNKIVLPRLYEEYDLPDDVYKNETFDEFLRIVERSAEYAKIELSRDEEVFINTFSTDKGTVDISGTVIDEEISFRRDIFDKLITEKINDTINCARKTMEECGVNAHDIDRIVWVGGPTHYKPLRDKVSAELGINGDILSNWNPMTAVAEGASLFAESIDWSSEDYKMKSTRGQISTDEIDLNFNYTARTPSDTSKIAVRVGGEVPLGFEFQIDSLDTGWTSGRIPLKHGTTVDVNLTKPGENTFKVVVYDAVGEPITIEQDEIVITKTAAIVEAIPSPSSITLVVHDKSIGKDTLVPLIEKGESLPKEGSVEVKARKALESGSSESLDFILLEGEFKEDIYANKRIGAFKIKGEEIVDGVILEGADLICNYKIENSAEIKLAVEVPDIRNRFESSQTDFYSPDSGKINYSKIAPDIIEEGIAVRDRIIEIKEVVDDPKLDQALQKLETVYSLDSEESDPDKVKEAEQCITQAKELLEEVHRKNQKEIRQIELNKELTFFDMYCRQHARPSEERAFDNLVLTAQRSVDNNDRDFDDHLQQLGSRIFEILWRQPWFIIEKFKHLISTPHIFRDKSRFEELAMKGKQLLGNDLIRRYEELPPAEKYETAFIDDGTIEKLREIVRQMMLLPRLEDDKTTERDIVVNIFKE